MEQSIKVLDEGLTLFSEEELDNRCYIYLSLSETRGTCPYCGMVSDKTHSIYEKKLFSYEMDGKKIAVILLNRKMFCKNENCGHKTFAYRINYPCDFQERIVKFKSDIKDMHVVSSL